MEGVSMTAKVSNKLICGVGIKGDGESWFNGHILKSYDVWSSMIKRCYSTKSYIYHPTYIGCTVCEDWHYYPTFKRWFDKNYIETFQLDKDLIVKGNKIYSPDTCVFIPSQINTLFHDQKKTRGNYPIGVTKCERLGKFIARMSVDSRTKHLGVYTDPHIAHQVYLLAKKDHIISVANEWKDKINSNVYEALMREAQELFNRLMDKTEIDIKHTEVSKYDDTAKALFGDLLDEVKVSFVKEDN